ncbi:MULTISPECIES: hypothetical protein [Stenotrophomonas maltophilia group]|uniref:hypothetical protein n=1 Tax=Stenotrophomonas maltophilia group TaxID=995085 RepID=UPI001F53CA97|nr:hypothetical protein [Stenotrophomonas sepilia]MCI1053886.1 hypothetical protein [Stenotrophomonas maltophilia]
MPHDEPVITWNLNCAGQLGLPKSHIKYEAQSSFYAVTYESRALQVLGDIEAGFAKEVEDAIEANPTVGVVMLGSGRGYIDEAMKAGAYIRRTRPAWALNPVTCCRRCGRRRRRA